MFPGSLSRPPLTPPPPAATIRASTPRSCGPGPEKRCMSPWQPITTQQGLPGYGPGCADVSAQGASSPPADAGEAPSRADRWGRPSCRPDSASACRQRQPETGCRGGGERPRPPSRGCGSPTPYQHQGPAPLASPGCPRRKRKGERTGSSLGGYEQIPRKTERDPEEVRSTPQPTRGPRPLRVGETLFSWAPPSAKIPLLSIRCCHIIPPPPSPTAQNISNHLVLPQLWKPLAHYPNLSAPLWQPLTTFLHRIYFAIKTLGGETYTWINSESLVSQPTHCSWKAHLIHPSTAGPSPLPTTISGPLQACCLPPLGSFLSPGSAFLLFSDKPPIFPFVPVL